MDVNAKIVNVNCTPSEIFYVLHQIMKYIMMSLKQLHLHINFLYLLLILTSVVTFILFVLKQLYRTLFAAGSCIYNNSMYSEYFKNVHICIYLNCDSDATVSLC